ncbi:MAG TPA: hypothetical protein VE775_03780, partial [Pyrinomonadaceae bacterium]|nr:hypothetical protein [Pyrinomonadaceae bacterium]
MPSNVKEKTQPRIVWSEESINVTIAQGEKSTKTLTLKSSEKIDDVMLEPVPELAAFLRVQPATLSSIKADAAQEVSISFDIPADSAPRTLEGTIHVRQGKRTLPQTLKVALKIEQAPEERGTEMISPAKVSLVGASEVTFNASAVTPVRFDITRASLKTAPETFKVLFNGAEVPSTNIQVTPASVALSVALKEGRNKLILLATDESWRLVYKAVTLWAGSRALDVAVFDENNQPAVDAVVNVDLGDDRRVAVAAPTVNGSAHFANLPDRTIFLRATATGNRFASLATHGGIGHAQLQLRGFDEPSLIDNNDFSQGTAGWNIGTARVLLVPHDEGTFNPSAAALLSKQTAAPAIAASSASLKEERLARHLELSKEAERTIAAARTPSAAQADE